MSSKRLSRQLIAIARLENVMFLAREAEGDPYEAAECHIASLPANDQDLLTAYLAAKRAAMKEHLQRALLRARRERR